MLLNGIFSMSEIALVSARKFKLESAAKKGNSNAKRALDLANNPNTFLSTVQIGITLIGILTGIFSGDTLTLRFQHALEKITFLAPYAVTLSVILIVIIITFFSIVFGELIPKRIGLMFPEAIASFVAGPMKFISVITKPFIWLLVKTNDLVLGLFGLRHQKEGIVSEEEIKAMVQESAEGGEIQQIEQSIVHRVFALGDRKVTQLMTHRNDLVYFDIDESLDSIKRKSGGEAHSVYPVVQKNLDKLLGIVSVKDIFPKDFSEIPFKLADFIRQPLMVHENTSAYKVLDKFKENRIHYAFVVDEYGRTQGMVSMDDIVDALVGDTSEYNQNEYQINKRDDGTWLADGQFPFFEFLHFFDISQEENSGDFNTLGGLILSQLNHMPVTGEKVNWKQFVFEVIDMDENKIDKILITVTDPFA
ncbi:MAG: HlyC/CorC family transporter [Chitinophagaceae bacterium]|nr:HlyC/CorC family transporter [Chitinophagaceae bacterium]